MKSIVAFMLSVGFVSAYPHLTVAEVAELFEWRHDYYFQEMDKFRAKQGQALYFSNHVGELMRRILECAPDTFPGVALRDMSIEEQRWFQPINDALLKENIRLAYDMVAGVTLPRARACGILGWAIERRLPTAAKFGKFADNMVEISEFYNNELVSLKLLLRTNSEDSTYSMLWEIYHSEYSETLKSRLVVALRDAKQFSDRLSVIRGGMKLLESPVEAPFKSITPGMRSWLATQADAFMVDGAIDKFRAVIRLSLGSYNENYGSGILNSISNEIRGKHRGAAETNAFNLENVIIKGIAYVKGEKGSHNGNGV